MLKQSKLTWKHIIIYFIFGLMIISLLTFYNDVSTTMDSISFFKKRLNNNISSMLGNNDVINCNSNLNDCNVYNNDRKKYIEHKLDDISLVELSELIDCVNRKTMTNIYQKGQFWIMENYFKSDWQNYSCFETITYTTHGDYTFLDNIPTLIERWMAPISISIYAPGTDFNRAMDSIVYLRQCLTQSSIIKYFITFHLYFEDIHIPDFIPTDIELESYVYNCTSGKIPYVKTTPLYKDTHNLTYPINVGRNLARDASLSHYVLASDPELYPNPNLVIQFLKMLIRNKDLVLDGKLKIFPVMIFEVEKDASVPKTKTELQAMIKAKTAIIFHKKLCSNCHTMPKSKEWFETEETIDMNVHAIGKRVEEYRHWEPIFIGTKYEPYYDERLSWEGQKDKMLQGYILCVKDYEFHILNNAFLVHRPGIKTLKDALSHPNLIIKQTHLIYEQFRTELIKLFGERKGCDI